MTTPDPGVFISSAQMYQELRSLSDGVTRVETKLDGIAQGLTDVGKDVSDHETRIRALERSRWPLPSLAALVSLGALALALFQALR
jgi:septal ring factor EnvC (AmiA/AmiB activator)